MKKIILAISTLLIFVILFSNCTHTSEEYVNIGVEKIKVQKFKEAIEDFNKAIEIDPKNDKVVSLSVDTIKDFFEVVYALSEEESKNKVYYLEDVCNANVF